VTDDCICGERHDEITPEQIVAAEIRKPLAVKENDPFPDLIGNSTVDFGTAWHRGGVFLSGEAAANCATPAELNRAEVDAEGALLCHVKAGHRTPGLAAPEWARGNPPKEEQAPKAASRPKKVDGRKGRKISKPATVEQRAARRESMAKLNWEKAAKRAKELLESLR